METGALKVDRSQDAYEDPTDVTSLKSIANYRKNLTDIINKIHGANDLDEILIDLKGDITALFEADRLTVFVVDGVRRELVSRFKSGSEISEIRVPISTVSLSGYAAFKQKLVNVKNAYDDKELRSIDPSLGFDKSWDEKTGYTTTQVLVVPIIFQKYMLGALQLINRKGGGVFTTTDEQAVTELAKTLGIALYNQKRLAKVRPSKYDYLLKNNILSQKELDKAISDARQAKQPIEHILINEFKVSKKDIGQSLTEFYNVPFVEYDEQTVIPGDLLQKVKVPFMRKNVWVPLRLEDNKIVIAIDNPHDIQRVDIIRTLFAGTFPGKEIVFNIALKDDVMDFIKLFTHDEKELKDIESIIQDLKMQEDEVEEDQSLVGEED
ncbi:GAF domain-containing protein, partial [Thermodesulfobacteriota bacterium]